MITDPTIQKQLQHCQYTWLITGVAGFIGTHLLQALLSLNQKVVGVDNFSTGFHKNLLAVKHKCPESYHKNFTLIDGNICDLALCQHAMKGVDYVLHHAALASIPWSMNEPEKTHQINVNGFVNMLLAAKDMPVRRFIFASSSAVYGHSITPLMSESQMSIPLSPYAASKRVNETYAQTFGQCYGIPWIGLRYFNVFGEHQNPEGGYATLIPCWRTAIMAGKPVYINGDGEISRDFIHVSDVVNVNLIAALCPLENSVNQIYNVGSGKNMTLNQLFVLFKKIISKIDPACMNMQATYRDFRTGDAPHTCADMSKIRELLKVNITSDVEQHFERLLLG